MRTVAARGWWVSAVGLASAATTLGLVRFGYSVLLPAMQADLGWSYAQAGALNTANALGYLAGAAVSVLWVARAGAARALRWSLAVTAVSLLACAATGDFWALVTLRTVGGFAAGVVFVAGAILAAWVAEVAARPGAVLALYYAGVGPGILLSTLLAPLVLDAPGRWRPGWLVLGILAAGCGVVAGRTAAKVRPPARTVAAGGDRRGSLRWVIVAFAAFGLGYIPFMTFVVAYWRDVGTGTTSVTLLWSTLAVAATASGWLFRRLLEHPHRALVALLAVVTAGAALPLVSVSLPALLASSVLFGAGFLAVSAAVTQLVRVLRPPDEWARTIAGLTTAFAGGQVVGPVLTGWLADRVALRGGLTVAVALLVVAVAAAQVHAGRPEAHAAPPR